MQVENEIISTNTDFGEIVDAKGAMKKAGAFFFLLMILEIPVSFLIYYVRGFFPSDSFTLISILITQGYLLLGGIIYMLVAKQSAVKDFRLKPVRISDFFLTLVLLITASPMASMLNVVSQFFAKNEAGKAIFSVSTQVPMWMGVAIIGCLPGVIEELLYRGIMLHAFRKRSIWTGVLVSGLSFGFMHMNFNQILYAVYLGILFALVVEATDSLLSTMLLHMLFNAINTAQLYILPKLYEWLGKFDESYANFDMESAMNTETSTGQLILAAGMLLPFAVGGLILTILLLKAIARRNGKEFTWESLSGCSKEMKNVRPITVCLVLGWIFCIINAIAAL